MQGLVKEIEELYKTRSECVHAALVDVEKAEVDRAVRFVTKTVEAFLTKPPYCRANALADILSLIDPPSIRSDDRSQWIAENAYFRWLNEGRPHDRHDQHWLDAEREFICTTILRGRRLDSFGAQRQSDDEAEQAE
jgi:Arc/MetJ-type ribon-helix-helix transcriptional regulator